MPAFVPQNRRFSGSKYWFRESKFDLWRPNEYSGLFFYRFEEPAMKIGYARVSTKDQAVDLQVDALKQAGCTKVFTEVISGARAHRPVLEGLLENFRPGDVLVIWKLDRLGRSLPHLIGIINGLTARKVGLKSLHDPIDTTTSHGRLILNLFASLSDHAERAIMHSRTAEAAVRPAC
jgi:DNA invertase Pin-like site-specific DNA recombinase